MRRHGDKTMRSRSPCPVARAVVARALIVCLILLVGVTEAVAETRLALIIANSDYPGGVVRPLTNPPNDAREIDQALREAGFEVRVERNLGKAEMENAVVAFARRLVAAGPDTVGFFYYSGHGASAQIGTSRQNYLLPARTSIAGAQDLPLRGVALQPVLDSLAATRVKGIFVVSDACRNTLDIGSSKGGSDEDRSFAAVPLRAGLLVAFATSDGAVAPDDGAYARQLATHLRMPGLAAEAVFTRTNRAVARQRGADRFPEVRDALSSTMDGFVFRAAVSQPTTLAPAMPPRLPDAELPRRRREYAGETLLTTEREIVVGELVANGAVIRGLPAARATDGAPGSSGAPGATRNGAGANGENGEAGRDGAPGGAGLSPSKITIRAETLIGQLTVDNSGQHGGNGGPGGNGGAGGPGARGSSAVSGVGAFGIGNCESGPGRGGDGGNGGRAGYGGSGGAGGNAGQILVILDRWTPGASLELVARGGRPGQPGNSGTPGSGGDAGPEGATNGFCGPAGRNGNRGARGAEGASGRAAEPGQDAEVVLIVGGQERHASGRLQQR